MISPGKAASARYVTQSLLKLEYNGDLPDSQSVAIARQSRPSRRLCAL